MPLTEFERSETLETLEAALLPDRRTVRTDPKGLLEGMMTGRPEALRHVWDVEVGRRFMSDCSALPNDIQECAIRNVAALLCSKYPNSTSRFDGVGNIAEVEIGRGYHIVFEFVPRYHRLVFYFVRQAPGAYGGPLRVAPPKKTPADADTDEWYGEIIGRSYEYDVEREDLLKLVARGRK